MKDLIVKMFKEAGYAISDDAAEKLSVYMDGILEYNQHVNLTSITEPEEFITKHYLDSASISSLAEFQNAGSVIDVGTGGGFPGVPLAVLFPEKKFTVEDSLQKRIRVIQDLLSRAGITNVEAVHARAEDLGKDPAHREQYDLCISRAVSRMSVLAEYCLPFVKMDGFFISYKGSDLEKELSEGKKAVSVLGGEIDRVQPAGVEGMQHQFVVVKKVKHTPKKYPRKAGTPGKTPIR
ncbi:MAG: 16S rRNA (guanine(527)-N(7))-methyltransferase RsmG [Eubacterium sp.]